MNKLVEIEKSIENQNGGELPERKPSALTLGVIAAGFLLDIAIVIYALIANAV